MEDSNIIALFFERSEHAIKETEIKYGKLIRSIAFRILKHPADTEECENDTYMGMWTSIPPVCPGNLKAYAAKTARNQALKKYRFQHAEKRNPEVTVSLSELEEQLSDGMNSLEKSLFEDRELADIINSFLADLKPGTRQVFMLRYWYFLSIKEIMSECGMSKSKVESILFRTRCRLKEYLERVWRVK
ncbi:MAG: sigma-70 family RNA polymerase sigma factor [Lachnospiraceae bacterium]|nr:sigma-70 family RNA polymerase sigma factor [Lachnospiraceae bacterium]